MVSPPARVTDPFGIEKWGQIRDALVTGLSYCDLRREELALTFGFRPDPLVTSDSILARAAHDELVKTFSRERVLIRH